MSSESFPETDFGEDAPSSEEDEGTRLSIDEIESLIDGAEIEGGELVPRGSNYTFAVELRNGDLRFLGIYKPAGGERPLWDYPYGTLHHRERCSFLISQALGWQLVPPTIVREGPHGEGSVQLYIAHDPESDYFTLLEEGRPELFLLAVFDLIVNNTDRKGGHCLKGQDGRVWGIDHGLTFHVEPKLRTVIWDFAGHELSENILDDLRGLDRKLDDGENPMTSEIISRLEPEEFDMLRRRVGAFLANPRLPHPEEYRSFPWPPI
ncbi:MAG: SCO1664 family protein [Nitrospinaceae bacterium]|nr:SCO1664 family protein [Nitrospinaceae bacterium]MBT3433744.1 SCO1664 family protein [Nitrospinaceae bacterium]MBT3822608.1 SCO1664 family protein [Nitrospinaceae bacterium]MBT4092677.1 SCO1664 family protein [Nitrospinaceae bacterium]MBT4432187.1 SCO1664 family protein [Nitrospinaceae bacterium]